jgi:hypothetical protein
MHLRCLKAQQDMDNQTKSTHTDHMFMAVQLDHLLQLVPKEAYDHPSSDMKLVSATVILATTIMKLLVALPEEMLASITSHHVRSKRLKPILKIRAKHPITYKSQGSSPCYWKHGREERLEPRGQDFEPRETRTQKHMTNTISIRRRH